MTFTKKLHEVQRSLSEACLDGWLIYDFKQMNVLGCQFLEIPSDLLLTRRFFYWIPSHGECIKVLNRIEPYALDHLPGHAALYGSWKELEDVLSSTLKGRKRIAMEYSPRNAIPAISKVDAGTVDLVRSFGVEVMSSSHLLQPFTSLLTPDQIHSHRMAADMLSQTAAYTWEFIQYHLGQEKVLTEWDVQQFILNEFDKKNYLASHPPICAVNANSANPHYTVSEEGASPICPGDFILIDLWCKQNHPEAIYADITRVAVAGPEPEPKQRQIFDIVRQAQRAATDLVVIRFAESKPLMGWEVDQAARDVIDASGYKEFFIHRTGHNIGTEDHGSGTHMDNYETHDDRLILPSTCFSIEPGIYLPGEFGVRLEYDICIDPDKSVEVTGGSQNSIECLLP